MNAHLFCSLRSRRSILNKVADVLGKLWAAPYTLLGLVYGSCGHLLALFLREPARACVGNNAIQFINNAGIRRGAALTLGNVILYGRGADPEKGCAYGEACANLGRHEQAHTLQYQLLGPLFVPVYFMLGGFCGPQRNPLERAAQDFGAGRGAWWPGRIPNRNSIG